MAKEKDHISIDKDKQGKFTAWVKNNMSGKTTCKAASIIVNKNKKEEEKGIKPNKRTYKPEVLKMANYANNFGCKMEGKGKKDSPANLTNKQRKLPEFIQKAILAKEKKKGKKEES